MLVPETLPFVPTSDTEFSVDLSRWKARPGSSPLRENHPEEAMASDAIDRLITWAMNPHETCPMCNVTPRSESCDHAACAVECYRSFHLKDKLAQHIYEVMTDYLSDACERLLRNPGTGYLASRNMKSFMDKIVYATLVLSAFGKHTNATPFVARVKAGLLDHFGRVHNLPVPLMDVVELYGFMTLRCFENVVKGVSEMCSYIEKTFHTSETYPIDLTAKGINYKIEEAFINRQDTDISFMIVDAAVSIYNEMRSDDAPKVFVTHKMVTRSYSMFDIEGEVVPLHLKAPPARSGTVQYCSYAKPFTLTRNGRTKEGIKYTSVDFTTETGATVSRMYFFPPSSKH